MVSSWGLRPGKTLCFVRIQHAVNVSLYAAVFSSGDTNADEGTGHFWPSLRQCNGRETKRFQALELQELICTLFF